MVVAHALLTLGMVFAQTYTVCEQNRFAGVGTGTEIEFT